MELLGYLGRVESRFSFFGEGVSVGAWFVANMLSVQK
jgi:hypothetical protein